MEEIERSRWGFSALVRLGGRRGFATERVEEAFAREKGKPETSTRVS